MRIREMREDDIKVGLKVRGLKTPTKIGVIVKIDFNDDRYAWIKWDGEDKAFSGFYGNDCDCEVVN